MFYCFNEKKTRTQCCQLSAKRLTIKAGKTENRCILFRWNKFKHCNLTAYFRAFWQSCNTLLTEKCRQKGTFLFKKDAPGKSERNWNKSGNFFESFPGRGVHFGILKVCIVLNKETTNRLKEVSVFSPVCSHFRIKNGNRASFLRYEPISVPDVFLICHDKFIYFLLHYLFKLNEFALPLFTTNLSTLLLAKEWNINFTRLEQDVPVKAEQTQDAMEHMSPL